MKSPFPGMDPYLESRWPEVHARLIVYAANQINSQLPDDLQANIEENLIVHADDGSRAIRPDVHIGYEEFDPLTAVDSRESQGSAVVAEPLVLKVPPYKSRNIEITNRTGNVITAIEILSPANKLSQRDRSIYLRKQLDYLAAGVNLVEIDLVRQGEHVLGAPLEEILEPMRTPYMICVSRRESPATVEIYRAPLDQPLPNIPIPLRPQERDIVLELQVLMDACYHDGRYYRLSYQDDPGVPFSSADTRWIDQRLRELKRRG